jgi:hypothetical protein
MKYIKTTLFIAFFAAISVNAQYTDVINSNRPGESQSAFSVGQTVFQAESGVFFNKEENAVTTAESNNFGVDLALRYGAFFEQLEFNIEMKYLWDQRNFGVPITNKRDFKELVVGAKYLIYDPYKNYEEKINILSWKANHKFKWRQFIPAVAIYGGANLNFNSVYFPENESVISPKLMLITQNQFSGGYVLVLNIIADRIGSETDSYGYVATFTKGFNEKWSGFLETQGFKSDLSSDYILRAGAAYLLKDNIQIDASVGGNFKDDPSFFGAAVGLSWRFDKNYTPLLIRSGKEDGKDKDKKRKKDKKKRKDEVETIEVEKP